MKCHQRLIQHFTVLGFLLLPLLLPGQQQNPFELYHRLHHIQEEAIAETTDTEIVPDTPTSPEKAPSTILPKDTVQEDSVLPSGSIEENIVDTSIFYDGAEVEPNDTLHKEEEESIELPEMLQSRRNLIFSTFIILTLFLTVVISFNRTIVNKVMRSILNDNYLNLLYREQKGKWSMQFVFLYIFFIANLALFLFLLVEIWDYEKITANLLYLCGIIGLIYFCRHLSLSIIGSTFPIDKETGQFNFTIMLFNIFLGLVLLPINLFVAFAPLSIANTFLYIGLGIIVLFYLLRQLRGIFIGARFILHNKFHFLLYLCTVEIAPVAVLYKFFQPFFI